MKYLPTKILTIPALLLSVMLFATISFGQETDTEAGIALYRTGSYDQSSTVLQKVVEINKEDKLAWIYFGASLFKLKKEEEAGKAFRKSNFSHKDIPGIVDKSFKITSKPPVRYTDLARNNSVSGTIKIAVEFNRQGEIGFVFPVQTLPDGLTENAIESAKAIRFEPAVKNGNPVTVVSIIEYSFIIY